MSTEYKIKISGDTAGLQKATKQAEGLLGKLSQRVTGLQRLAAQAMNGSSAGPLALLGGGGGVATIAAAGAALLANGVRVANLADEYGKLSQRTGLAVEDLSRLAYAASLNDASLTDLENGLKGLSKQMDAGSDVFDQLGISVRDSAGQMRPVKDVLYDVAEAFKRLPDGAQKAALANRLMEESGLRLIPLLNNGADGLRAMADEADRLGVTISGDLAKRSAELNDDITRLKASATGLANEFGAVLVPAMADFTAELLKSRAAGAGWGEAIWSGVFGAEDPTERIRDLTTELTRLRSEREKMGTGEVPFNARIDDEIAHLEKRITTYNRMIEEQARAPANAEQRAAADRLQVEKDLAAARGRMFDLLAVKHGVASNTILLQGAARHKAEVARAKELAKEYQKAYDAAVQSAKNAANEARALLKQAVTVEKDRNRQAEDLRDRKLSPEDLDTKNVRRARELTDEANRQSVFAQNAAIDGRDDVARSWAEQSLEIAKEAGDFAAKINDTDMAARFITQIGQIEKAAVETQAKLKNNESAEFDQEAQAQLALLQTQLTEINRLSTIEVDADITEATNNIATLRADLESLPNKTVTVTVKTVNEDGSINLPALADTLGLPGEGHAAGGYIRGPGTGTSDSILARLSNGEYVVRAAAVQHYGPGFLERINSMMAPRFAAGGLVRSVNPGYIVPAVASSRGNTSTLELKLPGGEIVTAQVPDDFDARLARAMRRAALARGSRR